MNGQSWGLAGVYISGGMVISIPGVAIVRLYSPVIVQFLVIKGVKAAAILVVTNNLVDKNKKI